MKHEFTRNPIVKYAADLTKPKDGRDFVRYICVSNGKAYATDTRALIAFDTGLEDGAYEVIKNTKTIVCLLKAGTVENVPDYESVLKKDKDHISLDVPAELYEQEPHVFLWDLITEIKGIVTCNYKYMLDLPNVFTHGEIYVCKNRPLLFLQDNVRVAIMGVYREGCDK